MTPSELANKIAEEVFRTIERENGLVKAEIADGIERVIAKEMPEFLKHRGKTWGLWSDYGLPVPGGLADPGAQGVNNRLQLGEWKAVNAPGATMRNVTLPKPQKYMGADYLDQDGQVKAFRRFTQYVGPPMAYYEAPTPDGVRRYTYQSFGWQSHDPAKIVARVEALAAQIEKAGAHTVVWRSKPELHRQHGDVWGSDGKWAFYCRLHVLPYFILDGFKEEGAGFPEA